jgi:hypothetical protein
LVARRQRMGCSCADKGRLEQKSIAAGGSADVTDVRLYRNLEQGWKSHQACRDRAARR